MLAVPRRHPARHPWYLSSGGLQWPLQPQPHLLKTTNRCHRLLLPFVEWVVFPQYQFLVLYLPTAAIISCTSLQLHAAVDSGGAISAMSRFFSRQFPLRPAGNRPNPSCITCKDGPSQKSGPSKAFQLRSHLLIWSDGSKAQMSSLPMQKRTIAGAHRMEGNVSLGKNHKKKCWDFKMYMKT